MNRSPRTLLALLAASLLLLASAGAASAVTGPLTALGDSDPAASGLGAADPSAIADCFRTLNGYPHLAAAALGPTVYRDASCAAAKIGDLFSWQDIYENGSPDAPPQLDTLTGDEHIVTLTIGDNDARTTDLEQFCLRSTDPGSSPCKDHFGTGGLNNLADAIAGPLAAALDAIHARAPSARIFLVGYLRMLPADVTACWGRINVTADDAPLVTGWQERINQVQKDVAAAHGAVFIDRLSRWTPGRDGCGDPAFAWVKAQSDDPAAWGLHATLLGQQVGADALVAAVKAAGLWSPPPSTSSPHSYLEPNVISLTPKFKRLRPVRGARRLATTRRPRRDGGRVLVYVRDGDRARLSLERRVKHKQSSDRARPWGGSQSLTLASGTTALWLTGSSARRAAPSGLYRLRLTIGEASATSRWFKIEPSRRR